VSCQNSNKKVPLQNKRGGREKEGERMKRGGIKADGRGKGKGKSVSPTSQSYFAL